MRIAKRSQINLAEYNPREISPYALKQLEKSLDKFGLAETLPWNERTGRLIGGHQRIAVMDRKNNYPENDYDIPVSVHSLSERREKEMNVWINNAAAQGHFEKDKFFALLDEIPAEDLGFTMTDLQFEFGDLPEIDSIFAKHEAAAAPAVLAAEELDKKRKETRAKRNRMEAERDMDPEKDADYYLMVCFDSANAKEQFLRDSGFNPGARFISAAELLAVFEK